MFSACYSLQDIYIGENWSTQNVTDGNYMFSGCSNLIGEKGTQYDYKKSDYTYGQRSIYKVEDPQSGTNNASDPFCVKMSSEGTSLWNEKNGIKIWDNDNVLRIECLSVNSTLADFRGDTADNSHRRYDNVVLGTNEDNTSIGWEEDFELVYPEKEEITTSKVFDPNKFINTVQPFTDWLGWLISTHNNQ
jgi:hypothetical protein